MTRAKANVEENDEETRREESGERRPARAVFHHQCVARERDEFLYMIPIKKCIKYPVLPRSQDNAGAADAYASKFNFEDDASVSARLECSNAKGQLRFLLAAIVAGAEGTAGTAGTGGTSPCSIPSLLYICATRFMSFARLSLLRAASMMLTLLRRSAASLHMLYRALAPSSSFSSSKNCVERGSSVEGYAGMGEGACGRAGAFAFMDASSSLSMLGRPKGCASPEEADAEVEEVNEVYEVCGVWKVCEVCDE